MGLIKSIRKRIKRHRFKKDLQNNMQSFLNSNNKGILESDISSVGGVIVSLTSFPPRIPTLPYTLVSLLTQNHKPNKLILWLSLKEFPNGEQDLPESLLVFKNYGLEIGWCEGNIKSYKKLIPTLKAYPDSIIVTADDDTIYPKDWLLKLYNAYMQNPQYIHCHRAHRIDFDKEGNLLPYNNWHSCVSYKEVSPSFLNFFTGMGGVLYPPHCFFEDITKEDKFLNLAPHQDDIWFWTMAILNDVKINVVESNYQEFKSLVDAIKGSKGSLWEINQTENDVVLNKIFEFYPAIKEKIVFKSGEYWEERYKGYIAGGGANMSLSSGAGSYNNLAKFKAEVLNDFVRKHKVESVLEFGCGDGNQLSLAEYPSYIGLDVSKTILENTKNKFSSDRTKKFYSVDDFIQSNPLQAELTLSLDVIYHLVEDEVFEEYMRNLFAYSYRFVGIYASNKDELYASHVKHRKFSAWIEQNAREWELYKFIPNAYPFDEKNPNHTSFADFYFYKKECRC